MTGFVDTNHVEILGSHCLIAHVTGHALTGEHATWVLCHTDRAGDIVRTAVTVRSTLRAEVVTLDSTGVALTNRSTLHVDLLAHCKDIDQWQRSTSGILAGDVCTNAEFLEALGVRNFDVCIVAISGNFQSSLETTSLLKELGAKMVVSRAERDVQAKFLLRNGADEVLYPEKQLAKWAAIRYGSDHVLDYIELDYDHAILEVSVPSAWIGKTVGDINIRKKYSINILGIKRNGIADVNIDSDTVLPGDGTLLVLGEGKALSRCFHI